MCRRRRRRRRRRPRRAPQDGSDASSPLCLPLLPHTHTHARTHARTRTRAHARTHARTHTRTHAPTHAHEHAHTHARTHLMRAQLGNDMRRVVVNQAWWDTVRDRRWNKHPINSLTMGKAFDIHGEGLSYRKRKVQPFRDPKARKKKPTRNTTKVVSVVVVLPRSIAVCVVWVVCFASLVKCCVDSQQPQRNQLRQINPPFNQVPPCAVRVAHACACAHARIWCLHVFASPTTPPLARARARAELHHGQRADKGVGESACCRHCPHGERGAHEDR